jgi:hypothetical protein
MKHLIAIPVLAVASSAMMNASILFELKNNPQPDEVNILLKSGATGTLVTGTPSGFPSFIVKFTSSQVLVEPSSGQARISASSEETPLTNLTIALDSGTYGDLIINPFIGSCRTCTSGTATITVSAIDNFGNTETPATFAYDIANGNNFLTIVASGGERITSTSIDAPGGFHDLRQPRISGLSTATTVPEPGTYMLLVSSLALMAVGRLRRSRVGAR